VVAPVRFEVPCETAYDYLVDPANRPEWQSSLKAVDDVEGPDGVIGQRWTDVTVPGLRPRMELTDADRPHRWSERGTWRSFRATLTLTFVPAGAGGACDVGVTMELSATGPSRALALALARVAPYAVRSDLKRAARVLAAR
jgi:uncharacterized protein YndB with AHSA1/START domain